MNEKTQKAIEVFDGCADLYEQKFMGFDLYNASLTTFCNAIQSKEAQLLELACGPGNITQFLLKKRPDFNILGTDLSVNMLALAQKNIPHAKFQLLDIRHVLQLSQQFDGIMCGFGLPYISKEDAIRLINDCSKALRDGGVLYISTMEGNYSDSHWKGPNSGNGPKTFTHYHEAEYLINAVKSSGLQLILEDRVVYPEPNEFSSNDLILMAQK